MCGIYGYTGKNQQSALMTLNGLRRLEYRGYDSFGIAGVNGGPIKLIKRVGKISEAADDEFVGMNVDLSIGHTRWATHGGVTETNAHPHLNKGRTVALVHNGIIENHDELRTELARHLPPETFISETDTEVIVHLIDAYLREGLPFNVAVFSAAQKLKGSFAFAVIREQDSHIVGVRFGSPLLFGEGLSGRHLSSDTGAFPSDVTEEVFLEDGEAVCFGVEGEPLFVRFTEGTPLRKKVSKRENLQTHETKGLWPHFMLKEITEQKTRLGEALTQEGDSIQQVVSLIRESKNVVLTGCGTAARVSMVGEYFFAQSGKNAECTIASEFGRRAPFVGESSLVLCISQSGETADTLEALRRAREKGARIVSILNARNSTMHRLSDAALFLNVGRECAVASTKAATAQILILKFLAELGAGKDITHVRAELEAELQQLEMLFTLRYRREIETVAQKIQRQNDMFLIGRGELSPIALEGALKVQEVAYVPALGLPGGELKHGPIALITPGVPCVAFMRNDEHRKDTVNNCHELKARGGRIIGVSPTPESVFDDWIPIPDVLNLSPIASLVPLQLLAYYLAVHRGNDPDMPRNLAKSVTVK